MSDEYVSPDPIRSYPDRIIVSPNPSTVLSVDPITLKCEEGYETYAFDKSTIGVQPKWISVKDKKKKPNIDGEYLVCSDKQAYSLAHYCKVGWIPFNGPAFQVIDFNVTHWMPLPKPPSNNES